jgi:uncharacterized sodium:solute symporter family permease YidK
MSYFGTDQSQVQRHLTARSVNEARSSLLMSAYWKIPLQALVLLVGVLVFLYYIFTAPPLLFNADHAARVQANEPAELGQLESRYEDAFGRRREAARAVATARDAGDRANLDRALQRFGDDNRELEAVRSEALDLAGRVTGEKPADVNYIIPTFVTSQLPMGLTGIFIAAVLAAAMSSVAAEFNALSTTTVIDFYRRFIRKTGPDSHFLAVGKVITGIWGIFACVVAIYAASLGSLIEVVNRFGSFFYGSILGVFLLAMAKRANGRGAFIGLLSGMVAVGTVATFAPSISFLWHNVVGAVTVFVVGWLISLTAPAPAADNDTLTASNR